VAVQPRGASGPNRTIASTEPVFDVLDSGVHQLVVDGPSLDSPSYRQFLEALGVAVYTTDANGHITFYNEAATEFWGRRPKMGELWCGSWKMYRPDGMPMPHDECPMAIALREGRSVRGVEGIAERPDGSRAAFLPFPTVVRDASGSITGAINVIVDVTERRRAEEALRAANAVKDEFLGLVSHELRTPVTTIFGNARLLRDRGELTARHESMVADIATDAERLLGVVENLLLLTRVDIATEIDAEPQVLTHVITSIVTSFERRHPGRSVNLDVEGRRLIVEADRAYLDLLLGNLLSNANKYSPLAEPIEVRVRAVGDEAHVLVLDRGIGIEPDEAEDLFGTFYRAEAAKMLSSGLGIGLSACRRVVTLLGGRIWARPRDDGGAEFGFALPSTTDLLD
jgi:PAS domain S-box-containing protein